MEKKYELTDVKLEKYGKTLFRIRALRDIARYGVKKGDFGGFIEKEENLSHDGDAWVSGAAWVYGNAAIMWLSKIGSRLETTTAFRTKDGKIGIRCGCFNGTLEEFATKVEKTHGDNKYGREYKAAIELIKIHFEEDNKQ